MGRHPMHGYDVEGGDRSGGGQRGMEGLRRPMCRLAQEGLSTNYETFPGGGGVHIRSYVSTASPDVQTCTGGTKY